MFFGYANEILRDYPELASGVLFAEGIATDVLVDPRIAYFNSIAESRLADGLEGELPEIQAWRRAFSRMGLKPTNYRCASESLLRRFRREKSLPRIHPLIDLCNSISLAFAIPIAVFDVSRIVDTLEVRYASGAETYLTFSGETENPQTDEVIFSDMAGTAHARRWTNRQSAASTVREETSAVLIVAEAMHGSGLTDVRGVVSAVAGELFNIWSAEPKTEIMGHALARFEFGK